MFRTASICLAVSLVLAVPAYAELSEKERPDVAAMSIKDIRIHNGGLDKSDPYYIICRRYTVTGTLAKRERTCLTKEDWALREERAQDFANQRIEGARNAPCGDCPGG